MMIKMSKYNNIFTNFYASNWSKEIFEVKSVKDASPWTDVIEDLNGEEIIGTFYKPKL